MGTRGGVANGRTGSMRLQGSLPVILALLLIPVVSAGGPDLRVVAVDAVATEILLAAGQGHSLVAVDASSQLGPALDGTPRLGYHRALAAEGILSMAPDLVVGSTHMGPPHVVETLSRTGVEVLALTPAQTADELRDNIRRLLTAVGEEARVEHMLEKVNEAEAALTSKALSGLNALFVLSGSTGKLRLAGAGTAGNALIELIGGTNRALHTNYRSVTAEALLALDPDAIFIADIGGRSVPSFLDNHPVLRFSRAVQIGAVFGVNPDALVAGVGLETLAEAGALQGRVQQTLAQR